MIDHFPINEAGRDFVVGDIHGCFTKVVERLDELGFDGRYDRLFSVGDLVDRGTDSALCLRWLERPWFHSVRGNHEQMAIDSAVNPSACMANGGAWLLQMEPEAQLPYIEAFERMPLAIEVELKDRVVGILHADCPVLDWNELHTALTDHNKDAFTSMLMWSRTRIELDVTSPVANIHSVIVGHTIVPDPMHIGNVHYIDTGAFTTDGRLTIIQL